MTPKYKVFLEIAKPNEEGISRWVGIDELNDNGIGFGNGGDWCRKHSAIDKKYFVEKKKEKGRIVAVRVNGFKTEIDYFVQSIPNSVKAIIKDMRCLILDTADPEIDHKSGDKKKACIELYDFQPLSKAANDAKRQHCIECQRSGIRYDAKRMGYPMSYYCGGAKYEGICKGCFWYDIKEFRSHLCFKE